MPSRTTSAILGANVSAGSAVAGYWYGSPFLLVCQMQAVAKAGDAEAFNQLVAQAIDPANDNGVPEDGLVLVFQRSGFADWKLSDIRIPALNM